MNTRRNSNHGRIVKTHNVCGGDACVKGTRIAVWVLWFWKVLGQSIPQLLDAYPHLTRDDVLAAFEYAREHPDEIEQSITENEGTCIGRSWRPS